MSNLYQHFYTSSDANIYLTSLDFKKKINLDLITGIGFNQQISSIPVYGLGNNEPSFFSTGNVLITGRIEFPYKSNKYLINALNYLYGNSEISLKLKEIETKLKNPKSLTDSELAFYEKYSKIELQNDSKDFLDKYIDLVNIVIMYDNTNTFKNDKPTSTIIRGVRFIGYSQGISSQAEGTLTDQYSFYGKNIETGNLTNLGI